MLGIYEDCEGDATLRMHEPLVRVVKEYWIALGKSDLEYDT